MYGRCIECNSFNILWNGGDNNSSQTNENNTSASDSNKKDSSKKVEDVSTKNISESSKPVGVSDFSIRINGKSAYLKGKISYNDTKYDKAFISIRVEIEDSTGKKLGTATAQKAVNSEDSVNFDEYISGNDIKDGETYKYNVTEIKLADNEYVELSKKCKDDIDDLIMNIKAYKEYNKAQNQWDTIKEKYGEKFKDEVKAAEAQLKDLKIDPNNISAGPSDGSN